MGEAPPDDLEARLAGLSPAKRQLLLERLRAKGEARAGQDEPPLAAHLREGRPALSFGQRQLWRIDQLHPGGAIYNLATAVLLVGDLDRPLLAAALTGVVARHEALRTRYAGRGDEGWAEIDPPGPVPLPVVDLGGLPEGHPENVAASLAAAEAELPFDLARGTVLRARLLLLSPGRAELLLTLHHIAADGWSIGLLMGELAELYRAGRENRPPALAPLAVQYADFAAQERRQLAGERLESRLAVWRRRLLPAPPPLALPFDRPRPRISSGSGGQRSLPLPPTLPAVLARLAERQGATLFMLLCAAFSSLLSRYADEEDVALGTPVARRDRPELEGLIGYFVDTLVLRLDLSGDPAFATLVERAREVAIAAFEAELPFELLVEELKPEREPGVSPFFQVLFGLDNTPRPRLTLPGLTLIPVEAADGDGGAAAKLDLSVSVETAEEGSRLVARFRRELFDAATILRLLRSFGVLLEGAAVAPQSRLSELPVLAAPERWQLLAEWNDTFRPLPAATVPEVIAHRAAREPGRPAVWSAAGEDPSRALTLGELDSRAGLLARRLWALGVGAEVPVALLLPRSVAWLLAICGVWKAGGAYLPLEPDHPAERLAALLADAGAPVVVTTAELSRQLPTENFPRLLLLEEIDEPTGIPDPGDDFPPILPGQAAYLLYTSGSTGRPKGVVVSHGSLANYLDWLNASFSLAGWPVPVLARLGFDASLKQLLAPLVRGVPVWLPRCGTTSPPRELLAELAGRPGARLNCVPSLWRALLEEIETDPPAHRGLAAVVLGGEGFEPDLVERSLTALPGLEMWNFYGPTEATSNASWERISRGRITIGRPIANARLRVLGRRLEILPPGAVGELAIGGAGLARGYHGLPERTAELFVPDPFSPGPGERLYRSGDRARFLPDGRVELLGRIDFQLKVRGLRIEPGEIEAALAAHPGVAACAVTVRPGEGGARLVGCVVPQPGTGLPADLAAHLAGRLPPAWIPGLWVEMPALPLLPSGKLDRRALKRAAGEAAGAGSGVCDEAPATATEMRLAAIWESLLGVERVGIHTPFFVLGGDSVASLRIAVRAREAGLAVQPADLFEHPTIADLAAELDRRGAAGVPESPPLPPVAPGPAAAEPSAPAPAGVSARDLEKLLSRLGR